MVDSGRGLALLSVCWIGHDTASSDRGIQPDTTPLDEAGTHLVNYEPNQPRAS